MKKKVAFWDKKNPKKTSKKLTPAQKSAAKAKAKAAGNPVVDASKLQTPLKSREALAARQWAVQRSVTTNLTDTVGVLNAISSRTDPSKFLDYNGVCNALASTTGLPAAQALRAISS